MAQQTIGSILKARSSPLITCRAADTVQMVIGLLHRHKVGAPNDSVRRVGCGIGKNPKRPVGTQVRIH